MIGNDLSMVSFSVVVFNIVIFNIWLLFIQHNWSIIHSSTMKLSTKKYKTKKIQTISKNRMIFENKSSYIDFKAHPSSIQTSSIQIKQQS